MKYFAIIDDKFLQDFKVADGECGEKDIILTNFLGKNVAIKLKPLAKPTLINHENGKSVYLSRKHVNILLKFEEMETIRKALEDLGAVEV